MRIELSAIGKSSEFKKEKRSIAQFTIQRERAAQVFLWRHREGNKFQRKKAVKALNTEVVQLRGDANKSPRNVVGWQRCYIVKREITLSAKSFKILNRITSSRIECLLKYRSDWELRSQQKLVITSKDFASSCNLSIRLHKVCAKRQRLARKDRKHRNLMQKGKIIIKKA